MKYVITDKDEVVIGGGFHANLAEGLKGKVVRAGHCEKNPDGTLKVCGKSEWYGIKSQPEDAEILHKLISRNY